MTTTVVRANTAEAKEAQATGRAAYIGRAVPRQGYSKGTWSNPFKIGPDGTREEVLRMYEEWLRAKLRADDGFIGGIRGQLKDRVLICWCKPAACHGDLLARLCDMSASEYAEWLEADAE